MVRIYSDTTSFRSPNSAFISLLLENTPELTELNLRDIGSGSDGFLVIGKSAATLESLAIFDPNADIFRMLFVHADGRSIVYPRLRTLKIRGVVELKNDFLVDTSAVPFPVLQHFQADSCCGFVDDLPFRGNNNTLTFLYIALDTRWERIFRQFGVFEIGKYPCLHNITVSHNHQRNLRLSRKAFVKVTVSLLSPAIQRLSFKDPAPFTHLRAAFRKFPYMENLQIVLLEKTKLSYPEIIELIQLLPNVTNFGCGLSSENLMQHQEATYADRRTDLARYYPLSNQLKYWHIYYLGMELRAAAEMAITLVMLCPRLTFVDVGDYCIHSFEEALQTEPRNKLYPKYSKRIKRLLR